VAAYSAGLAEAGVISVTKHFPGHGGTADSHLTLPFIDMEADTARAMPFAALKWRWKKASRQ
jgi:beta-N-acetylhexosaminidase